MKNYKERARDEGNVVALVYAKEQEYTPDGVMLLMAVGDFIEAYGSEAARLYSAYPRAMVNKDRGIPSAAVHAAQFGPLVVALLSKSVPWQMVPYGIPHPSRKVTK